MTCKRRVLLAMKGNGDADFGSTARNPNNYALTDKHANADKAPLFLL